jgi:maltose O-acetyltransferase
MGELVGRQAKLFVNHVRYVVNRRVVSIQASDLVPRRARVELLRRWGVDCALDASVLSHCFFTSSNVRLGAESHLNHYVKLYASPGGSIEIGDGVSIGPGATLVTLHHELGPADHRAGRWCSKSITVGNGSWLGANVVVLPGVSIGAGCVIAAGAVVTRDCEPNGLYAGVPARRVRDIPTDAG